MSERNASNRDDAVGAQMDCGRERRREPDTAVAVPRAIDVDGRERERKGR
ncbi:MAG TPA: hypothetical protein VIK60_08105 [Vicinamibacterales bacterium]